MGKLTLQAYHEGEIAMLADFLARYLAVTPHAKLNSPDFYTYHPVLKGEENAFCVLDDGQKMVGFAPIFPLITQDTDGPGSLGDIWTVILVEPGSTASHRVRQLLFDRVVARAEALKVEYGQTQVRLAADMMDSQRADIDFLLRQGFEVFEQMDVMQREVWQAIPEVVMPPEVTLSRSDLRSEEAQAIYLGLYRTCFPENPKSQADLQFLIDSPLWQDGCALMAFRASDELAGSILVYRSEDGRQGVMDDVMVAPAWRGRGVAKGLVAAGLQHMLDRGMGEARLEVRSGNLPAVSVYRDMGFRVIRHEVLLGMIR